jgi:hypothetical protein
MSERGSSNSDQQGFQIPIGPGGPGHSAHEPGHPGPPSRRRRHPRPARTLSTLRAVRPQRARRPRNPAESMRRRNAPGTAGDGAVPGWPAARSIPLSSREKGTPLGHAVSQARHPMHWSKAARKAAGAGVSGPATICSSRTSLPRGDWTSLPVANQVAQCGRHRPHWTQVLRSEDTESRAAAADGWEETVTGSPPRSWPRAAPRDRRVTAGW